jgi:lactoylglutathione lyase
LVTGHWHSGVVVEDIDLSVRFYTEGLGLKMVRSYQTDAPAAAQVLGYDKVDVKVALLEMKDGAVLELLQYVEPHTIARQISERHVIASGHLALLVDDVAAILERVVEYGGTRRNDPAETEPGTVLTYAQDPDGNWLEFAQIAK